MVVDHHDKELNLPWHDSLWQYMATALSNRRVAHGLLFAGAPGVGKRRFAARVAAALLCRQRTETGDACGSCSGCRQRLAGTHPDIVNMVPEDKGKNIKVDQVRKLSHALHLTPQYPTGRIGWIDPADALFTSAANSLLKTLEEPPAECHLLLVSDRVSSLLPTIRSRCQIWTVPAADPDTGRQWLDQQGIATHSLDADRLHAPLAVQARREADADRWLEQWDKDLARLLSRRLNPATAAEHAYQADCQLWLDWLYRRCNALLQASMQLERGLLSPQLQQAALKLGSQRLQLWSRHVTEIAHKSHGNADWRLAIESVYIELAHHVTQA